jgi:predicted methyltransferase
MATSLLSNVYVVIKRVLKPGRKKSRVVRSSTHKYLQTKVQKVVSEKLCTSVVGSEDMLQYLA